MGNELYNTFGQKLTKEQCKDAGMAFSLIFILIAVFTGSEYALYAAGGFLVITMTAPGLLKPLAIFWFWLARVIGTVVSRLILGIVFFLVVTPVALIRRLSNKDSLRLREFKGGRSSVMDKRNHTFGPKDIEKPF